MTLHAETIGRTTVCLLRLVFRSKEASDKVIGYDSSPLVLHFLSVVFYLPRKINMQPSPEVSKRWTRGDQTDLAIHHGPVLTAMNDRQEGNYG